MMMMTMSLILLMIRTVLSMAVMIILITIVIMAMMMILIMNVYLAVYLTQSMMYTSHDYRDKRIEFSYLSLAYPLPLLQHREVVSTRWGLFRNQRLPLP